jgi:hypothetical protein
MRKIFLIVVLMLGWVMEAKSQEGLQIAELFNGQYKRKDNAIEVVVKGNQLERYKLEVFRSLTIKNDPKDFERIEKLVEQDKKHAISKETGHIGERLYYAFYCFPPQKGRFRYVFYRNSSLRKTESNELTLIYMEGNVTMDELKMMFKK